MALIKANLKADIKLLLQDMMERDEASFEEFSERLSTAIDEYIKDAMITTTITQITAATMVAGPYPVTVTLPLESTIS
jgi:hypothetical protein